MRSYVRENVRRYEKMTKMGLEDWAASIYGGMRLHDFSSRDFLELALPQLRIETPSPTALELYCKRERRPLSSLSSLGLGRRLRLVYSRLFSSLPTLAQQPDNVIQLAEDNQVHILDAKYRVGADLAYLRQFESPGPTADDINTMHRYRDAIVLASGRPAEYERMNHLFGEGLPHEDAGLLKGGLYATAHLSGVGRLRPVHRPTARR